MDKEICIDTNICIEIIKENPIIKSRLIKYSPFNPVISAITVFELFMRKTNLEIIEEFIKICKIIPIDENIAKKASEIYKDSSKLGHIIEFRDSLIGATCIVNNYELLTLDKKDFLYMKGLKLLNI